ncbi:hypothetical protein BDW22DRAFT_974830 [Trametopsis cervina]|nr:hypothetical protein BDW22DRAFT_974830 [Trametopsis cervina]
MDSLFFSPPSFRPPLLSSVFHLPYSVVVVRSSPPSSLLLARPARAVFVLAAVSYTHTRFTVSNSTSLLFLPCLSSVSVFSVLLFLALNSEFFSRIFNILFSSVSSPYVNDPRVL